MDVVIGVPSRALASARACNTLLAYGCASAVGPRGSVARMRAVTPGAAAGGVKYRLRPAKLSNAGVVNGAATACSCALVLAGSESVPLLGPVPLSPPHAATPSATPHN